MENRLERLSTLAASELGHLAEARMFENEPDIFDLGLGEGNSASLVPALARLRQLEIEVHRCRDRIISDWPKTGGSMRQLSEITGIARPTLVKRLEKDKA